MRKAAKVFIIIGIIINCIFILPTVIGCLSLKRISEAKMKKDLVLFGILTIIFCDVLGGIFMLCIKEKDLPSNCCEGLGETEKQRINLLFQKMVKKLP